MLIHSIDCIRLVVLKTEEENLNNRNDKILQNNKMFTNKCHHLS